MRRGRIFFIVLILWLFIFSFFKFQQIQMVNRLSDKKSELNSEISVLRKDIANFDELLKEENRLMLIERIARDEYNMVKPRELIYIVD